MQKLQHYVFVCGTPREVYFFQFKFLGRLCVNFEAFFLDVKGIIAYNYAYGQVITLDNEGHNYVIYMAQNCHILLT